MVAKTIAIIMTAMPTSLLSLKAPFCKIVYGSFYMLAYTQLEIT